jgi:hypothetical protein
MELQQNNNNNDDVGNLVSSFSLPQNCAVAIKNDNDAQVMHYHRHPLFALMALQ